MPNKRETRGPQRLPGWALSDDVLVTLIELEPNAIIATVLVEKGGAPKWAPGYNLGFVLHFKETQAWINGEVLDQADIGRASELADALIMAPPQYLEPGYSVTTRLEI